MTTENENIVNATNLGAILEGLKNIDRSTLTEEANLEVDQTLVSMGGEISSERKSQIKKIEDAKVLERWNAAAEKNGVFKALDKTVRDMGDELSIRFPVGREKNTKGEWEWSMLNLPSQAKGEDFFPTGRELKFRYQGQEINNQAVDDHGNLVVNTKGEPVWGRGAKHAAQKLCRAIGLHDEHSPGTTIKRQLEKVDAEGNPAGKSFKRTQLEQVEIQHPSINGGKWQKLTEFYMDFTAPAEESTEE